MLVLCCVVVLLCCVVVLCCVAAPVLNPSLLILCVAFHLPFWFGVIFGGLYQAKNLKDVTELYIGKGANKLLLGVNLYGTIIAFGLCFIGMLIHQYVWVFGEVVDPTADVPAKSNTSKELEPDFEEEKSEIRA